MYWFLWLLHLAQIVAEDRCTAIIVGKDASANGHPMTTHTNDCSNCDFRLAKVPAMDHAPNSTVDIPLVKMDYPRYVGYDRGSVFYPENLDPKVKNWDHPMNITKILGTIPQVNHTYAYIDGLYGILNEHQLAIGESTCGGRLVSKPVGYGGKALFDVTILSRLAMQRTKTAREAIQLMGQLAETYGYYGAVFEGSPAETFGEAGEALTVTDPNEAWIFHIHPDDTGASAVWVAQRVPDGEMAAVANQFVIHQVNFTDTVNFMGSSNVLEVAQRQGFWKPEDGAFDFTRAYSMVREHGLHYYCTRRIWRLFTLANSELELSPYTDVYGMDYPYSVTPSRALTTQDIMRFQRDHYEGTPFDMTAGPASGPYGNPDRYDVNANGNMSRAEAGLGRFERAISIFRASYSFVSELNVNNSIPKVWFGHYAPHATTYIPIYAQVSAIPSLYSTGSLFRYDPSTSYWAHSIVGNWVSRYYNVAIPFVKELQRELETKAVEQQDNVNADIERLLHKEGEAAVREYLTNTSTAYAQQAHASFTTLFTKLVTVFHDGYKVDGLTTSTIQPVSLFYPKWWLQQVGYFHHPDETQHEVLNGKPHASGPSASVLITAAVGFALVFTAIGAFIGIKMRSSQRHHYTKI